MRLDLPGRVPLPDDVRRRALDTVLAGLDEAPPRGRTALPLLAAAVAAALVVSTTVAVGLAGRAEPVPASPPAAISPAPTVPPLPVSPSPASLTDAERCTRVARDLPGTDPGAAAETSVTEAFELGSDRVLVLDAALACLVTPDTVTITAPGGTRMGAATASRLGPAVVAVHNPDLRRVDVTELPGITVRGGPEDPVRVVLLPDAGPPEVPVRVAGSFDGPLPEPAPPVAAVRDRDLPVRPVGTAEDAELRACLDEGAPWAHTRGELFLPVLRHQPGDGSPPVLLARIGDRDAGICLLRADGPQFTAVPLDLGTTVQTAPGGDWAVALLAVPPGTTAVDVAGEPCPLAGGLALCTGVDEGAAVTVDGPAGPSEVVLPTP